MTLQTGFSPPKLLRQKGGEFVSSSFPELVSTRTMTLMYRLHDNCRDQVPPRRKDFLNPVFTCGAKRRIRLKGQIQRVAFSSIWRDMMQQSYQ